MRTDALGKFKRILDVDPDSLESILPRTRTDPTAAEAAAVELSADEWERLIQILKHQLERVSDPDLRLLALQHVGEIYEHQLEDRDRALRWWAQVLTTHPFVEEACEQLERLAGAAGDWSRVVQVYTTALGRVSPADQRRVRLNLARVHLEEQGQPQRAERIYRTLWQNDQDLEALEALERYYADAGRQDEVVKLIQQKVDLAETVDERAELLLRMGYLYEVELGQPRHAVECYRQLLREDRLNRDALEALEQVYLKQEGWLDLLQIYERLLDEAESDKERTDYLIRMARISDDFLGERTRSRELWGRVLEVCGEDEQMLQEMARRFESTERFEELANVLYHLASLESDPQQRARIYERQGRILGDKLEQRSRALASWREVLAVNPDSVSGLLAVADLYRGLEQWEELLSTLRRLITVCTDQGKEPAFLISLQAQIADLQAKELGHPDTAIDAWRRVLELDPANPDALDALESLLAQQERWQECLEILQRKLQTAQDGKQRLALLERQAGILRDGLGDNDGACAAYRQILELQPQNEVAHDALCSLLRQEARFEELVEQILAWLQRVQDPQQAVRLLHEAAVILEEHLGQTEKAFVVWQSALQRDLTNEITISNLERLAGALSRYNELLALYDEVLASTASAPSKVVLLTAMGRCHGLELGQIDRAVALLHEALRMDPESIAALEILEECYRRTARWHELVPVLKRHADLEQDGSVVVELLTSMGRLQSRLGDPYQAIVTFEKVLEIEPSNLRALESIETLYLACGYWERLVGVLRRQLELVPDDLERVIALKNQIGEIYDHQLGEPAKAIASYQEVLALDADNVQAMRGLESLYDQTDQSEAYLEMVERLLEHSDSQQERREMYPKIATAWEEQFDQPQRAMATLEKLITADPQAEQAYVELERLCRDTEDPKRLADVLRRHAEAVSDEGERVSLLLQLGETHESILHDPERAIEAYSTALELEGGQSRALSALARLHERQGNWQAAVEDLQRLVPLLAGKEHADALFRLARVLQEELQQQERAEEHYAQALTVDSTHFDSMMRLVDIYRGRSDWAEAAAMMIRAEPHTSNQAKKVQLLHEAGMIHLTHLQDEARAVEVLSQTLAMDPDHLRSGLPLSEIYFREGMYERLEPVLDMLARKVDRRDKQLRHQVCFRLGCTAAELDKRDKAIQWYQEAYRIDTTHLPTLQALAELHYSGQEWAKAFKFYQTLLTHHRPSLSEKEVVEVFYRLGEIKLKQSEWRKARNYLEKALEQLPTHRPTLQSMVKVQQQMGNWQAVVQAKTALLELVDEQTRFQLHLECGRLLREQLNDIDSAVAAYHAAVKLRPDDRELLTTFIEVLTDAERWSDALQMILRLTEVEENPQIRARFFYTAAVLCRDRLDQVDRALDLFNMALDCAPDQLKAFQAIDRILTQQKNWQGLERNYMQMIARLPNEGAEPLRGMLWHNLGEVYRTRLRQLPDAIAAFEIASRLEPEHQQRHEILAELYTLSGPQHAARAIEEHRTLLARDPARMVSYHALQQLHLRIGDHDGAWCICGALALLKQATDEQRQLFERHRRPSPRRARARMNEALWHECILHRAQDRRINTLLVNLAPPLMEVMARPVKDFGLKRRQRIKPSAGGPLVNLFHYATSVLGSLAADLYYVPEQEGALMMANTSDGPCVAVNEKLMSSMNERHLAFTLGQYLTYLRPEYILCRLFTTPTQLRLLLAAVIRMTNPAAPLPPMDMNEVNDLVQRLSPHMTSRPGLVQHLAELARPLTGPLTQSSAALDLGPWWNSVGLTALRVGFILCDDLMEAASAIQSEPALFGTMPASEKVKQLVNYCISPEYRRVRRELQISITS